MESKKYIIGIDEVGRGCLAGPVVVVALALPEKLRIKDLELRIKGKFKNKKLKLRDSKKLSLRQREIWFQYIKKLSLSYGIAFVSPKIIDKINISRAANLAATRASNKLIKNIYTRRGRAECIQNCKIFLDGGLYLKELRIKNRELRSDNKIKNHNPQSSILNSQTIIKGDEKIPAISLASIIAKVYRDKLMKRLHKKYPKYDFINNVGYGTKKHIKAIRKFGYSQIHRKSFKINL